MSTAADDAMFMSEALAEAQLALDEGEVPVGCVFVHQQQVLSTVPPVCLYLSAD